MTGGGAQGNYALWESLEQDSFTVGVWKGSGNIGIHGVQIVEMVQTGWTLDMPDVHFSLVEGTSTTLDLTGYASAGFGDPLPLTYHPSNESAFLTLEGSFASEAEFKTSWLWDLAGEWDVLEYNELSYIDWDDATDWTWDGSIGSVTMEFTPMPEPATMLLLGFGALAVLLKKKRRS